MAEGFTHHDVTEIIMEKNTLIFTNNEFYRYEAGVYKWLNEIYLRKLAKGFFKERFSKTKANEVIHNLQAECFIEADILNSGSYINLKNGMFNLENFEVLPHDHKYYSSIQLNVAFEDTAMCPTWVKTLEEIFENDADKIQSIQEFFGLCLTHETIYEKALILVGEGQNGKSVILYILEHLIGDANRSAVSVEKFNDSHYIANLYNKLINVSIETSAKGSIYDSAFKSIVSGDSMEADAKYKKPFMFRPFCKLIISSNNMPRVDDKTNAYFRRLIILRFNRQFTEKEQKRSLKYDILRELNGIFLWSLMGLQKLRDRGYFDRNNDVQNEIDNYRRENNNVLVFFEECCYLEIQAETTKKEVYNRYVIWCKESGYKSMSKIKFCREFIKLDPKIRSRAGTDNVHHFDGVKLRFFERNC